MKSNLNYLERLCHCADPWRMDRISRTKKQKRILQTAGRGSWTQQSNVAGLQCSGYRKRMVATYSVSLNKIGAAVPAFRNKFCFQKRSLGLVIWRLSCSKHLGELFTYLSLLSDRNTWEHDLVIYVSTTVSSRCWEYSDCSTNIWWGSKEISESMNSFWRLYKQFYVVDEF